jgi:hypothetical protein
MATLLEQAASLFGIAIKRPEEAKPLPTFAPKEELDGAVVVAAGGQYGTYVDLDGTVRTEAELVNKYRDMSLHPEVMKAIRNIVNEGIIVEEGKKTVELVLDEIDIPDNAKEIIEQEFDELLRLLEFNQKQYHIFSRWYVDGRLYYHVVIDEKALTEGIQELRYLDPRKIRKVREVTKVRDRNNPTIQVPVTKSEYYLYTEKGMAGGNKSMFPQTSASGIKIAKDSVVHATSGLTDTQGGMIIGHLHPAIKPLNQLRALEDAAVIYSISRAPERRVFYIDVGNLPKIKAEQYVQDMMRKHRNKLVYDSSSGEIRDDRKFMTMQEDYWLPRREGGKGTEIDVLPPGQLTGELGSVEYFKNRLYEALQVPLGRLNPEATFDPGRSSVITRDELMFSKFIDQLRSQFNSLFLGLLEKQLILKEIMSPEDWDQIKLDIGFRYLRDNHFSELKDNEILMTRLQVMELLTPILGKVYSWDWARRNVFKQNDEDIAEQDKLIGTEAADPQFATPIAPEEDEGMGAAPDDMNMASDEDVPGPAFAGMKGRQEADNDDDDDPKDEKKPAKKAAKKSKPKSKDK